MSNDLEIKDVTEALPSLEDVEQARSAIRTAIVRHIVQLVSICPELAVQLPNIHRCLTVAEILIRRAKS